MKLNGKVVLLTGASGGIGHAIARQLHSQGAKLILTARREQLIADLANEIGGTAVTADLSVPADVERLGRDFSNVDAVVHNAAIPGSGDLDTFSAEELDRVLDVNLRAPQQLTRLIGQQMVKRGDGHIVFINSVSGKVPTGGASLYAGSKLGLRGFAQALRVEYGRRNVGVSSIFPGFIRNAGMFADTDVTLPPGVGTNTPEEVAAAVVKAITKDRGEITVAPRGVKISAAVNALIPGSTPRLSELLGGKRIADQMAQAQEVKR